MPFLFELAFIANVVVMPTVSQEIFIPQLIARGLPICGCQAKFSVPLWLAYVVFDR